MKKLVLVDGNALLHRAYHATPPLSTSQGVLVNAVYGFTLMLLKALEDLKPEYLAVAWDKKAPTFRHVAFDGYKANRIKADDALLGQYEIVDKVLKSLSIPQFSLTSYEADDLIGCLAKQAEKKNLETIILTGDKDLMQLISSKIKILMPKKTISDVGLYGEEEFNLRYGFSPQNLIDYKGLAGDASDNIPGISGIGEVTATKLIQEYGTLEKVYQNINKLPEKLQKLLKDQKDQALMSKKLATIEYAVPIKLDLEKSKIHKFDKTEAIRVFEELEFKSLIKRIPGIEGELKNQKSKLKTTTQNSKFLEKEKTYNVDNKNQEIINLDEKVDKVLKKMTKVGVLIDLNFLSRFGKDLKNKLSKVEQNLYSLVGHQFNPNSPKQLQIVLFDELKLPVIRKTKTGRSTDEQTLVELFGTHPIIAELLEYRKLFKLISTYIDALPKYLPCRQAGGRQVETGRIHSTFNVEGASTGRISSQEPNLQNIPVKGELGAEIRKGFVAPEGKILLGADYSQIELRILAHLSDDENLKKAFESGLDIHATTASKIFQVPIDQVTKQQRAVGKTMNFATLYGQGPHALAQSLKVDYVTAQKYIEEYFAEFPKIRLWKEKILKFAREKGYSETLWGRRRYFPELKANNRMMQSFGERSAINHPIQGTAADMIKKAMVEIEREIQSSKFLSCPVLPAGGRQAGKVQNCCMILQIHDELLFECQPDSVKEIAKMVKDKMENALKLSLPVVVDLKVGKNWGEMESLKI